MHPAVGAVGLLLLATVSVLVVTRLGHGPGDARTHLYETPDGERANPLSAVSEAAARSDALCDGCGTAEVARAFDYCVDCLDAD